MIQEQLEPWLSIPHGESRVEEIVGTFLLELPAGADGMARRSTSHDTRGSATSGLDREKESTGNIQDMEAKMGAVAGLYQMFLE